MLPIQCVCGGVGDGGLRGWEMPLVGALGLARHCSFGRECGALVGQQWSSSETGGLVLCCCPLVVLQGWASGSGGRAAPLGALSPSAGGLHPGGS